jgi:hypothetical protein
VWRRGIGEDVSTAWAGSCGRRGDLIAIKSATRESFRSHPVAVADRHYSFAADPPSLGFGVGSTAAATSDEIRDISVTPMLLKEQVELLAAGSIIVSRHGSGIITTIQNQSISSHYEYSC